MRRDYFTLDTDGVTAPDSGRPAITISYEGPTESLKSRLWRDETPLAGDDVDVTYRLQDSLEDNSPMGVLALSDRVTGEYILELNVGADAVLAITDAVGDVGDSEEESHYRIVIETADGEQLAVYDKSTLLVYDFDGEVLRDRSLIPSGVEI